MIITTIDSVPDRKIKEVLGIAKGSTIRSKHLGKDIVASLRQIIGGELKGYTEMFNEAREEAISRMVENAKRMKADAVVNVRFMSAEVMPGAAEMLAYGTAIRLKK